MNGVQAGVQVAVPGGAVAGPGFMFWGLFVACAAVLLAYLAWMLWTERQ